MPDQQPFRLESVDQDGSVLLQAGGEIDVATASLVERRVVEVIESRSAVVLDLAEVTFIDSSGLRALVTACQHAEAAGVPFTLAGRSAAVERLLQVTGLDSIFDAG